MHSRSPLALHLLDGPYVTQADHRREIPDSVQRLVVLVALRRGPVGRQLAAGSLWPAHRDNRAAANLRSVLWRLRSADLDLLVAVNGAVSLHPDVEVDLHAVTAWSDRIIDGSRPTDADLVPSAQRLLALELLPGWHDDWVLMERERLRQRILHTMETVSRILLRRHHYTNAVEAAMLVVSADPLRESAQRVLIEAHLGERNLTEAHRTYEAFRALLWQELGVLPSAGLRALVEHPPNPFRA